MAKSSDNYILSHHHLEILWLFFILWVTHLLLYDSYYYELLLRFMISISEVGTVQETNFKVKNFHAAGRFPTMVKT